LTIAVESVLDEKLAKELAEQSAAASEEVLEILSEYLENISNLSVEEVKAILEEKSTQQLLKSKRNRRRRKRMKALLLKTEKNMCLLQMLLQYLDA
jgi:predicted transcriptional regulator